MKNNSHLVENHYLFFKNSSKNLLNFFLLKFMISGEMGGLSKPDSSETRIFTWATEWFKSHMFDVISFGENTFSSSSSNSFAWKKRNFLSFFILKNVLKESSYRVIAQAMQEFIPHIHWHWCFAMPIQFYCQKFQCSTLFNASLVS